MKDHALKLARGQTTSSAKRNVLREYLQTLILRSLHSQGFFEENAVAGGTALRFLHQLPRFTENLEFVHAGTQSLDWPMVLKKIRSDLIKSGYSVTLATRNKAPVYSAYIKFSSLLFNAGISPDKDLLFPLKMELNTCPPAGATFETKTIMLQFPVSFLTYDMATLVSEKIQRLLFRRVKNGRDFFDLAYILSQWKDISPNFKFLEAMAQPISGEIDLPTAETWRPMIAALVVKKNWKMFKAVMKHLLEKPKDNLIPFKEDMLALLLGKTP